MYLMQSQYLRPMGLGEMLDASVRLYRKNFHALIGAQLPLTLFYLLYNSFSLYTLRMHVISFFGLFGYPHLDSLLYFLYLWRPPSDPLTSFLLQKNPHFIWIAFNLSVIYVLFVYPVTLAAVTKVASDSILERPSSAKNAYTFFVKRWWKPGLLNSMITGILVVLGSVSVVIVAALLISLGFDVITFVDLVLLLVVLLAGFFPFFFLWARFAVCYPVMVNEDTVGTTLKRSWTLVKGYTIKVFSAVILILLVSLVITFSSDAVGYILDSFPSALLLVCGTAAQALVIPLVNCTRVVIYFSLRARKEGFDLEKRVEQLQ